MSLVFVTVGTDHHPFDRVMQWTANLISSHPHIEAVVQHGDSHPPAGARNQAMMDVATFMDTLDRASVVVCHGGPGSIMEARGAGHLPIVVPREKRFGEHVDDHQVRFATRLSVDGMVQLARSEAEFRAAVTHTIACNPAGGTDSADSNVDAAIQRFAALVDDLVSAPYGNSGRRPGRGARRGRPVP